MANLTFNNALGKVAYYAEQARDVANAALIIVLLEATGLETDATLRDYDDLATLLAGTSNEQTTLGRKTIAGASVVITTDDTNDRKDIDVPDQVYTASAGNATGKALFCFDANTTTGTDANITPLTMSDFTVTPDGSTITLQVDAVGFIRITG